MDSENIRAFICVDFPDAVIKEAARVQNIIEKIKFTGKITELENLHITLKFLGEVEISKLEDVKKQLSQLKHPILKLELEKTGTFSIKGNPKIIWIKTSGNIFTLQKQIDASLSSLFPKEKRFMSHLTIARIKHVKDTNDFRKYIDNIKVKKIHFLQNTFKLMKATLYPDGPVYDLIQEFNLGG